MSEPDLRVALITGASSGIGRACAMRLHAHGWRVYGTSRHPADYAGLPFDLIQMDVDDNTSVQQAVASILKQEGRIDAVVNCAGFTLAGAVEDVSPEEARAQFETNVFGAMRVCRAVLPTMRAQRSGTIVNIGSIAGEIAVPFQGIYSASKAALGNLTMALRMEMKPFGVRVVLVEPGDIRTNSTFNRRWAQQARENPAYRERAERSVSVMAHDEQNGAPPEAVARVVERAIRARRPRACYTAGPLFERLALALKAILPPALFEAALMLYYKA